MTLGERVKSWTATEIALIIEAYFRMLRSELEGEVYSKRAVNRKLQEQIGRSPGAIEYKHSNISHILREMGSLYIEGYKPRSNVQEALRSAVQVKRQSSYDLDSLMLKVIDAPDIGPTDYFLAEETPPMVEVPGETLHGHSVGRIDFPRVEAMKRSLGLAGEKLTVQFEQRRLQTLGRKDLAKKVEHVSVSEGDGLGYDIRSYDADGSTRFIEVKTTRRSKEWPFFVSHNEVRLSKEKAGSYYLYRLFRFGNPKQGLYTLQGSLEESCLLRPYDYYAVPRCS
ncbi:DUF3883 domain-containing protein [Arthrobacter sp. zg-Y1143]|uniref:DUF3883 domain-containing protein n=1 Tax=Arthrobacter sp. zg-Y1143 TaxID=3049065 RepID=UPI0024C28B47|nr:DUF3883 domain-containing protein [Arthrobacter sp. zg-Y1143]MDK1328260.1 DUF3883 domain-containing protein [Arthrobacter sp. zg-Y1143]